MTLEEMKAQLAELDAQREALINAIYEIEKSTEGYYILYRSEYDYDGDWGSVTVQRLGKITLEKAKKLSDDNDCSYRKITSKENSVLSELEYLCGARDNVGWIRDDRIYKTSISSVLREIIDEKINHLRKLFNDDELGNPISIEYLMFDELAKEG